MKMEQTDWTDLRGIANDFVMPVGEILNSKKETVCSDLIVSAGWVTRAGHQERGHDWRVPLSWHRESSHHTWVLQLSTVLCLQGAGGEQVKVNLCRAGSPFLLCQPICHCCPLPGGAHACARLRTSELLGLLALLWGHPSALQRVYSNSRGELHLSMHTVQLTAAAFQEWRLCRRTT